MERSFPIPIMRNKERCPHLSLHMDCHAGGSATADCFHPHFHKACPYRKRAERNKDKAE
jgi:hypothetical protein